MNNQANDALCDILRKIKDIIKSGQISTEELVTLTDLAIKVAGAIQGGSEVKEKYVKYREKMITNEFIEK